jgi:GNAT superfamily N-acetyltransferase
VTVAERDLVDAIESSLFLLPPPPGVAQDLAVPGIRGRITKVSHPIANLAGDARFSELEVDAKIAKVRERYGNLAFGWVTGPSTRPVDLPQRLVASGFRPIASLAGMVLTDLAKPIAANADVREIPFAEALAGSEWMGRAYGMPTDVTRTFNEMIAAGSASLKIRGYFAYLAGEQPVAWSYLMYLPDSAVVLLGGAATLPEHRGRGLYSALVAKRLADARADGRTTAIIQADRDTSAPICEKLGFREVCALEMYASPAA